MKQIAPRNTLRLADSREQNGRDGGEVQATH
jgi:hypothetical protein